MISLMKLKYGTNELITNRKRLTNIEIRPAAAKGKGGEERDGLRSSMVNASYYI